MKRWPGWRWERRKEDLQEELEAHLQLAAEDRAARGEQPEETHAAALHELGNVPLIADVTREQWGWLQFERLIQNIRYALRQLRRSPGFALTGILALALAIGPNIAIFSIIWATFLAPLPYPNADRLVVVWAHHKGEREGMRGEDYAQYAAQSRSFERLDFSSWRVLHLTNPDHSEDDVGGWPSSPGLMSKTLGVPMALGRDFLADEGSPGKDHVVILNYGLWQLRYHADPHIVGKFIRIQDEPYMVVGVSGPSPHERAGDLDRSDINFSLPFQPPLNPHNSDLGNIIGRLKPGVTLAQAQAELSLVDRRLAAQGNGRKDASSWSVSVEPLRNDWLDHKLARNLWLLLAAVGLVLLIACANVANLLLARGSSRQQEIAVRSALGATRGQVFSQLLVESLTLALLGGATGIAMGWGLMKLSVVILPDLARQTAEAVVQLNLPVLGFALGITMLAGVLFGCAPGWQASRVNLAETLKQGARSMSGRSSTRTQAVLVATEFALALTLLSGAGMAMHSFWNLSRIDTGIAADHVLTARLRPLSTTHQRPAASLPALEQRIASQRDLVARIRAVPGVSNVALATNMPLRGYDSFPFTVAGQPADPDHPTVADFNSVTPGFFKTLGIRLLRGRFLNEDDTLGTQPVLMVNETFVRRFLPGADDPLTHRLLLTRISAKPGPYQIVGVFHDVLDNEHLTGKVQPEMYMSLWQIPWPYVSLAVRTVVDPGAVTSAVRQSIASSGSGLVMEHAELMQTLIDDQRTSDRFGMVLFVGFAAVSLLLAALGIYGVMAFAVAQRSHEIGVRMALGAQRRQVVMLMVRTGMRLAMVGIAIGLAGAFVLGRLMHSTLYGVGSIDLASFAAVASLLFAVAVLSAWLPARRSATIDPMQALRNE